MITVRATGLKDDKIKFGRTTGIVSAKRGGASSRSPTTNTGSNAVPFKRVDMLAKYQNKYSNTVSWGECEQSQENSAVS